MKNKIELIILIVIFIIVLILINVFLNQKNTEIISKQESGSLEIYNQENKEEVNMDVLQVKKENFEQEVLKSEKTVLIDFYADWCGPCKMLSPIVESVAKENEEIKVVKVNVDDEQDLAIKYNVLSIPTLVVIKNGQEVNRSVGLLDKSEILDLAK